MTSNYTDLLHWVREREAIRLRKEASEEYPWTNDEILHQYRFCNVRREDDLGTRWIRENIREPYADNPNLWLMLCLARQINWPDTMAEMIAKGVWPIYGYYPDKIIEVLAARKARGAKLFTGAYIISAGSGGPKHEYIINIVVGALTTNPPLTSLQNMHKWLSSFQGWGPFMAYQAVVDMRYTSLLDHAPDLAAWAAAGPGTIRGLNRVFGRHVKHTLSQAHALEEIQEVYKIMLQETNIPVDFSDIPNILCETDKYLRVKNGEGTPRAFYIPGRGA